eukprot:5108147-Prymnesium_polylepis.1
MATEGEPRPAHVFMLRECTRPSRACNPCISPPATFPYCFHPYQTAFSRRGTGPTPKLRPRGW